MKKASRIDRLARKEEKETVKRIFYLTLLSVILAVILFVFGIPILAKFSDLLGLVFKGKSDSAHNQNVDVRVPVLDSIPHATNSAKLMLSGFGDDESKILIFKDDSSVGETQVFDGKFQIDDINLDKGENNIKAKAIRFGQESSFSDVVIVLLDNDAPKLDIETPYDGQSFNENNRIRVTGTTEGDAQVYANGFLAIVNADGKFDVLVPVLEGETTIEIKAIDDAGNAKIEKRKVNFHK